MEWLTLSLILVLAVLFALTRLVLKGPDLRHYDRATGDYFDLGEASLEQRRAVEASLASGLSSIQPRSRAERLQKMREFMDAIPDTQTIDATIEPVDAGGVPAEWVIAPDVDVSRRVLYIHGGAFMMGSPKSHRNITSNFSRVANAAVLSIDYRLMPEHARTAGIEDCRSAYRWLLENGPHGKGPATKLYMGGDSAGGNLTLTTIAWIRDARLRQVDAAVALSPVTDVTFNAPSLRVNLELDVMLGPMFRQFMRAPNTLLLWVGLLQNRMSPSNPVISPVFGHLDNLPPTLLHASDTEVLRDDAIRYVNKAQAAGSPARLQMWNHMPHVWHMFYPELPEAQAAWDEIGAFIAQCDGASTVEASAA
jgi:acetyl esterase/lipase